MSVVGLAAWLAAVSVASDGPHIFPELPPVWRCSQPPAEERRFTAAITIYLDFHGAVGEPYKCPKVAFSLNFSQVDLNRSHRDFFKQVAVSTVLTLQPIDARVRGYLSATPDGGRRVLMVTDIYNWRPSRLPPLFLRRD